MKRKPVILSIDPGVPMGYAVWSQRVWNRNKTGWTHRQSCLRKPKRVATMKPSNSCGDYHNRAADVVFKFMCILDIEGWKPIHAFIEWPQEMQSFGGRTSSRSGSIIKLSMMVGQLIHGLCLEKCIIHPVSINLWKGQLSKRQTQQRVRRLMEQGRRSFDPLWNQTHEWDAVGIGLHCQGHLL